MLHVIVFSFVYVITLMALESGLDSILISFRYLLKLILLIDFNIKWLKNRKEWLSSTYEIL